VSVAVQREGEAHVTAQQADDVTEADDREVVRRAELLCRRAEPHADSVPCAAHLQEAHRQLFGPGV
jgi:hypothetical protein